MHAVQLLINSFTSEFIVGQYITSLALRKHVSAPRWLVCILVSISGQNMIGMMTPFSLKVTPFWIVCSSPYNLYSLIHRGISSLVSGHLAKIVTFRACSWLPCFVSSRICTNYWSVTLANSSASTCSMSSIAKISISSAWLNNVSCRIFFLYPCCL